MISLLSFFDSCDLPVHNAQIQNRAQFRKRVVTGGRNSG